MWKHRDTGTEGNFIEKVAPTDSAYGYVALYNEGDSLLREAWMGYNDAGFAIMNTASYNVAPYVGPEDREGEVMALALRRCASVDDFVRLLDSIPHPAGIMANFGVMDASGALAYIEADDHKHIRYDVGDEVVVRTNYSMGWDIAGGKGLERYCDLNHVLAKDFAQGGITPLHFINKASHSFYDSAIGVDYLAADSAFAPDNGRIIPRGISTASIVIEGASSPQDMVMWTVLGFPPLGYVEAVTLADIPYGLRPVLPGASSPVSRAVNADKRACMQGKKFDLRKLKPRMDAAARFNSLIFNQYINK